MLLFSKRLAYDDPLIERKPIHQNECDPVSLGITDVSGEESGDVVKHDWGYRRQIDQPCVTFFQPGHKYGINFSLQGLDPLMGRFGQPRIWFQNKRHKLSPGFRKMKPVIMPCILFRDGGLYIVKQAIHATRSVCLLIGTNTNGEPGFGQRIGALVGNGVKQPFKEQIVNVDTDIIVVER